VWPCEAVVCLHAASRVKLFAIARAMDSHIMHCDITGSCQSADTSESVKHFCSPVLTHVSSDIVSYLTFTFSATVSCCIVFLLRPTVSGVRLETVVYILVSLVSLIPHSS